MQPGRRLVDHGGEVAPEDADVGANGYHGAAQDAGGCHSFRGEEAAAAAG